MSENGRPTKSQRAMLAADAVAKMELGIPQAVEAYNVGASSVRHALNIKKRSVDVASDVRTGKCDLNTGLRRVGYSVTRKIQMSRGDKWDYVMQPAVAYAQHWAGREFSHINPKEAQRRLKVLRELQEALYVIDSELTMRSGAATLRVGGR